MPLRHRVEFLRDALGRVFSSPALWLIAFCFILGEGGCNAQASDYPDGVATTVQLGEDGATWDGQVVPGIDEDTSFFIHNGAVFVADGFARIRGQRDASGAEAVGAVLGTWAGAVPTGLLLLVLGAWLLPGYYRQQVGDGKGKTSFRPGTKLFRRVLAVRVVSACAIIGAAFVSATPGLLLLTIAGLEQIGSLAVIAMVAAAGGAIAGWLYVLAGLLFADREAVFSDVGPMAALRISWSRGRGRRLRRLTWALSAWVIEVIGSLGWYAWFIGFFTHPVGRALADTMLTRLYIEEAAQA